MGTWAYIKGVFIATWSGLRHLFRPRMTLRYPEQKLDLEGPGYQYDAKKGVGLPGFKGRHILYFEKCTGCQLCAIACDGVAVAIDMQKVQKGKVQNKKDIWPAVDYGRCVPPFTPIITIDGVKPISEIRVGDRVLTHTGKFRKVTKLFERNYTGKLYTFWTSGNPESLTTTEDHPILVFEGDEISWSFASEIKRGAFLTRPVLSEPLRNGIHLSSELYGNGNGRDSPGSQMVLISRAKLSTSSDTRTENGMVVSQVIGTETAEVKDFRVQNLEVEDDNSYVAANIAIHNCVFCGLCVDACPFDALFMTNEYELSAYDRMSLKYTPDMLAVPPKLEGKKYKVEFDAEKGVAKHG
ncbi:MAG TPA: 4Fe-4S binding protein [Nitrososphaerales archaeon]|nr:4Fe-4S binding protein [Nitrososphaerales archaeon]